MRSFIWQLQYHDGSIKDGVALHKRLHIMMTILKILLQQDVENKMVESTADTTAVVKIIQGMNSG
jgi:hypothetical protein